MKVRHRPAPISDCTVGVGCGYILKGLLSLAVPEGMPERDRAIEIGLQLRLARDFERDRAELRVCRHRIGVLVGVSRRTGNDRNRTHNEFHGRPHRRSLSSALSPSTFGSRRELEELSNTIADCESSSNAFQTGRPGPLGSPWA